MRDAHAIYCIGRKIGIYGLNRKGKICISFSSVEREVTATKCYVNEITMTLRRKRIGCNIFYTKCIVLFSAESVLHSVYLHLGGIPPVADTDREDFVFCLSERGGTYYPISN